MPTGPAARITDKVLHVLPGLLQPGPGSFNVIIGGLPAWRGLPAAAVGALSSAKAGSDARIKTAEAATLAAAGTPGYAAAKAAEMTLKAAEATAMATAITGASGGADIHVCVSAVPIPVPPPHGPGVVIDGSPTVFINGLHACRVGDTILEAFGPPNKIIMGCPTVIIGDKGGGSMPSKPLPSGSNRAGPSASGGRAPASGNIPDKKPASCEAAPAELHLPKVLNDAMKKGFTNSFPDGKSQEQGGTIVKTVDGTVKVINEHGGTSGTFSPDRTTGPGEKVIGIFHTHPYDKSEGGHEGVSFSGADIAIAANENEPDYVDAGSHQFAIVATDQTPKVNHEDTEKEWNEAFANHLAAGLAMPEASRAATRDLANKYKMAYYEGKDGVLQKISR